MPLYDNNLTIWLRRSGAPVQRQELTFRLIKARDPGGPPWLGYTLPGPRTVWEHLLADDSPFAV